MVAKKSDVNPFVSADARELWDETTKTYELSTHEKFILKGACRALDKISDISEDLEGAELVSKGSMGQDVANPLLGEQRAQQAAFDRAMKQLDLPDADGSSSESPRSTSAREAAAARWGA